MAGIAPQEFSVFANFTLDVFCFPVHYSVVRGRVIPGHKKRLSGMRVIKYKRLKDFYTQFPATKPLLDAWYDAVTGVDVEWLSFNDVREMFSDADLVGKCVVFNIGWNRFRLIAKIHHPRLNPRTKRVSKGRIYIRTILTHADYMKNHWKRDCGA